MHVTTRRQAIAALAGTAVAAPAALAAPTRATPAAGQGAILRSGFIYESAPYPQCHASTIVELADGTIAASWFGGTRERDPDVEIWFARLGADGWQKGVSVANGIQPGGARLPTWNPVLFQDPAGPLHLFYKIGPNPREWWGMVISSTDGGARWSAPRRLADGVLGPIKNKPVVLADGSWLSPSSLEADLDRWSLHFERSTDRGRSWTVSDPVPSPQQIMAIQPSILFHAGGKLQAVARTRQGAVGSCWSEDGGKSWGPLGAVDLPNPSSGTDAVTLADGRHLIVYNHSAHRPESPGKGSRWPLNIGLSEDGLAWRNVLTLESEPITSGYAYPAVIQARDGKVHITYTHGRTRIRHVVVDPARLV
ncbi:putative neuraminidase [Sphingomonas zeicaulis]|uniref:sialidase family protein n=1 Tax=Sphingomonas zeicaulis TaxID=1632740 RepID=UPI003D1C045A